MNIQRQIVTNANWDTGRGGNQITGIVLHTMVGTTQSAYNRFNDPSSQVSVHYGISLDGSIHQWVDEANTAWQAGNYQVNQTTIGIEHEDNGNAQDSVRTPQLYESSATLVADICRRYNIPCDTNHIFLHKDVIDTRAYPGGTSCPDALDTNKIINMAQAILGVKDMQVTNDDAPLILAATLHTINPITAKSLVGLEIDTALNNIQTTQEWKDQDSILNVYMPQVLAELGLQDPSQLLTVVKQLKDARPLITVLKPGTYEVQ